MATIWKELLFLHGHFARPQDVLDDTSEQGTQVEVPLRTDIAARLPLSAPHEAAPRSVAAIDADGLACGGCR